MRPVPSGGKFHCALEVSSISRAAAGDCVNGRIFESALHRDDVVPIPCRIGGSNQGNAALLLDLFLDYGAGCECPEPCEIHDFYECSITVSATSKGRIC